MKKRIGFFDLVGVASALFVMWLFLSFIHFLLLALTGDPVIAWFMPAMMVLYVVVDIVETELRGWRNR